MRKRILAIILALCMILSIIPIYAATEGGEAEEKPTSYFSLGIPVKDELVKNRWNFKNLELVGNDSRLIKYAKVVFASQFESGDSLHLDSNENFTATYNDKKTMIEITPKKDDLTNQDWVAYLRGLYATLTRDSIEYAISITSNVTGQPPKEEGDYLYRAETDHYYEYIDKGRRITWKDAYEEAKDLIYLGRQGYLVTVTSAEETAYIASLVGTRDGWMGGTRMGSYYPESEMLPSIKEKNNQNLQKNGLDVATQIQGDNAWFWADGADDEVGFIYYPVRTRNNKYDNLFQYTNWDGSTQPDDSVSYDNGTENCMHFYNSSQWNDYKWDSSHVTGYFVEFGGKSTDKIVHVDRTTAVISLSKVEEPMITSKFNEEVGTDAKFVTKDCVTTIKGETVKPKSFILKKENAGNYKEVNGAEGTGPYQMIASYIDGDGNSYYSEKNAEIKEIKLKIQLKGLDTSPGGYTNFIKEISMEPGSSYVAEAPEIPGYTVDVPQQTVDNIKLSKTIIFNYTKQEDCTVTVKLDGLEAPPDDSWARGEDQAFIKNFTAKKGQSYPAVAPVVEGYLVDRYAVTLDSVSGGETVIFHYVKEGIGNKGCNVKVVLKDTTGKTLSAEGYATSYVVEKGAGIKLAAPEIPGYTFQEGSFTPKAAEGYELAGKNFKAAAVEKNTTVTFTYKKIPEYTVTVKLAGLNGVTPPQGYSTDYTQEIQILAGGSYTAIAPQIEGYTVDKIMDSVENVTSDQTITFTYTKPPVELGPYEVTVELLEDGSDKKIDPPVGFISKFYVAKGGGYSLTPPALNGYTYAKAENESLTPIDGDKTVKFYYTKPETCTITIVLKGASLTGYPKTVTIPKDSSSYTAIAPVINGKKVDAYSKTVTANGDKEIVFTYTKLKGPSTPKPPEEEPEKSPVGDVLNADDHIRYMVGHASGLFGPEGDLTRAQCAQIFYNLLLDKDATQRVSFPDVPEDKWYARAIETLAGMDVLRGYSDGTFQPEKSITRAEFTAIAMRFGELDRSGENPFPDVTEDRWYYSDVVGSAKYGWIQGYTDGTFRPEEKISRTEVTYIVNRMLKRTADQGYIDANPEALASFPDLPSSYWGYYSIMEATNAHDHTWKDKAEVWTKIR